MPTNAGDLTNKIKARHVFADWTRQKEAARLGLRTPLRIQSFNGGVNPALAYQVAVEGAAYTTLAEQNSYIAEVDTRVPSVVPVDPVITPSGIAQWATTIGGPGTDSGNSIATDTSGNVYVTGIFSGTATISNYSSAPVGGGAVGLTTYGTITSGVFSDIFIVKYNSSGAALWATTISGPGGDVGYSITTDTSGNVYVTGFFAGPATIRNYSSAPVGGGAVGLATYGTITSAGGLETFIVKYSSSGSALWATTIGGTGGDEGYSIATDTSGNVYITGYFSGIATISNYSSAPVGGGEVGRTTYGTITSAGGSDDIFIVKYNSSGSALWATTIGGTGADSGNSIATDTSGNVYITGGFSGTATISNYSSAPVGGGGVGLTTYGTITIAGSSDTFIVKYNSSGAALWATTIGGTGGDIGNSIATDTSGNVYVTGFFSGIATISNYSSAPVGGGAVGLSTYGTIPSAEGSNDIFIVKYNSSGSALWATTISGTGTDRGYSITTDTIGNVYVTGYFRSTATISNYSSAPIGGGAVGLTTYGIITSGVFSDIFIVKYNSSGAALWATTISGAGGDIGNSIATDTSGNVYVTGFFSGIATISNYSSAPVGGGAVGLSTYGTITSAGGSDDIFIVKFSQ